MFSPCVNTLNIKKFPLHREKLTKKNPPRDCDGLICVERRECVFLPLILELREDFSPTILLRFNLSQIEQLFLVVVEEERMVFPIEIVIRVFWLTPFFVTRFQDTIQIVFFFSVWKLVRIIPHQTRRFGVSTSSEHTALTKVFPSHECSMSFRPLL